jgi:molybdopterin molybdotransferase
MPSSKSGVLSFEDARHLVEQQAATVGATDTEIVSILKSAGRVLAEPLIADRDFPPFPRATRDGYAVRASDIATVPVALEVIGEIKAGATSGAPLRVGPGQAVSIMTGAAAPAGADAVVMVEYTSASSQRVEVARSVSVGENVVPTGSEAKEGATLVDKGTRLGPSTVALAASVGKSRLKVCRRPRIAVLATGDELVEVDAKPGPQQIRNSNSYSLAVQVEAAGGEALILPVAPDEPKRLRALILEGLECDLLLLSGGVSMGKYDLVEQVLEELHAEFFFTGAQIQPGRPIVFGRVPPLAGDAARASRYFFGLPGNPVSTMVTFELFARPMIESLGGMISNPLKFTRANLKSEIKTKTGLKRFLPGIFSGEFENATVDLVPWQGSGDIAATARANCHVVIPPDRERMAAGEWVAVLLR